VIPTEGHRGTDGSPRRILVRPSEGWEIGGLKRGEKAFPSNRPRVEKGRGSKKKVSKNTE